MKLLFKIYNFLVLLAVLLLIISFFIPLVNLDINLHDTYYVITNINCIRYLAIFLFIVALLYKLLSHYLAWNTLSWIHIILSISLYFAASFMSYRLSKLFALAELTDENSIDYFQHYNTQIMVAISGFILVQFLPIINLIAGLTKRKHSLAKHI